MATVIGIDVGGGSKGFHGVALADGGFCEKYQSSDAAQMAYWCRGLNATTIAIDAPCRWSTNGRARIAERALMQSKIWCFSTPTKATAELHPGNYFGWMLAGQRLYAQLSPDYTLFNGEQSASIHNVIETFPHGIACALLGGITSARNKNRTRREILTALRINSADLPNIDFVDAALCALTANRFESGDTCSFGSTEDGFIVLPRSELQISKLEVTCGSQS